MILGLIVLSRGHAPQQTYQREKKTDVGMERLKSLHSEAAPHHWCYMVLYMVLKQHYGGCCSSVVISKCHCVLIASTQVFRRGNQGYQMGKNNTQESNILKRINYLFLEKAENVNG